MTIAKRLKAHLEAEGVAYETIDHPRTVTASATAQASHIPGSRLAKTVVLHLESGPVLAVVPSSHRVDLSEFALGRQELGTWLVSFMLGPTSKRLLRWQVPSVVREVQIQDGKAIVVTR